MLGATQGHEIEVAATGSQAAAALAAIRALAERDFDDRPESRATGDAAVRRRSPRPDVAGVVRGHPASPGIAIGPARRFRTPDLPIPEGTGSGADAELAAFDAALDGSSRGEIAVNARASPRWRARTRPRSSTPTSSS